MAKYTHTAGGTTVKLNMPDFSQATKDLGVDERGKVQAFATKRAAMRMDKYVPTRTGTLRGTADYTSVPTEVTYVQPYARPMYFGISQGGKPINYNGAPQRGAFWDEKMVGAEGDQWAQDVQEYSDRLKGNV